MRNARCFKQLMISTRVVFALMLLCFGSYHLLAQTHQSVPISQTSLYEFLDVARIRGMVGQLPAAKPYSLSHINRALLEIDSNRGKLQHHEQAVLDDLIERYVIDEDQSFNLDGDVRLEDEIFPTRFGGYVSAVFSADFNRFRDSINGSANVYGYARGDLGKHLSWSVQLGLGGFLVDDYNTDYDYGPAGWQPYTYTKEWDGGLHPISSLSSFIQMPTTPAAGYSYETEIAASIWENRVNLRFGRLRHEWGIGEGSLQLDASARPFFALEGTLQPFKWISFSAITGILEYGETYRNIDDYHIAFTSREQQNMFSALQVEITPVEWLYLSFFDGGIYLKRPEWGYVYPFMSKFLSQNNTGDFDNLMMGGSIGLSWPGIMRSYISVYLDEARFTTGDFFHNPANMYSFQVGVKAPIPGIPLSTLTVQYTKIEPFTYTHYAHVNTPWYTAPDSAGSNGRSGSPNGHPDYAMDTGYMNGGESLAYALEPNSDEILIKLRSHFRRGVSWHGVYRMIRHGFPGSVPGSSFDTWGFSPKGGLTPDNDPNGAYGGSKKNFLKDGVYEWFHIFSAGGRLDMRIWNEPVQIGLDYSFVYLYYTDYSVNKHFRALDSSYFPNTFRNIVTFTIGVSPY